MSGKITCIQGGKMMLQIVSGACMLMARLPAYRQAVES
jgi:hypothetical protein